MVAAFFDLDGFADAVAGMEFTQREEVALLIDSMRCEDPKIRLAAQKQFHTLKKAILEANGLIGTAKLRQTHEDPVTGQITERTTSVQTLLTHVRKHQERLTNVINNRDDPAFQFHAPRALPQESGVSESPAEAEAVQESGDPGDHDQADSVDPLP